MSLLSVTIKSGKSLLLDGVKCSKYSKNLNSFNVKSSIFPAHKVCKPNLGEYFECSNTIKTAFAKQINMLSKEQRKSLNAYTQSEGFDKLNSWLRVPDNLRITNWKDALKHKNMLYHASNIDDALAVLKAPCDLTVYRGIDHLTMSDILKLKDKSLTDLAYGSSSLSQSVAENFGDIILKIKVKKGMNCGYIDSISDFGHVEHEVLLPRGYTIKIGKVIPYTNTKGKTKYIVEAEMLNNSKPKPIKTYFDSLKLDRFTEFEFLSDVEQVSLNLSDKQLSAIKNVRSINKYLKNPAKTIKTLSEDGMTIKEIPVQKIIESRIANIDSVLQSVKSSAARTVYFNEAELVLSKNSNIQGTYVNNGYTICRVTMNMDSSIPAQNLCKLEIPKGANFYFDQQSGNIILPRDTKFKTTNISSDGSKKVIIC